MDAAAFREQLFSALGNRLAQGSGYISSNELASFDVAGEPRRLIANSKGIWNPRDLEATLSVVSSADGPYVDEEISPGVWRYDYEAGSIHGSNTKLRRAMDTCTPIILLRKIATGVYVPHFPVYVVADSPKDRFFTLAIDDVVRLRDPEEPDARRYAERVVKQCVHQPEFRGKVLLAYENRCAVFRLRHPELLDAAHILPDSHPLGNTPAISADEARVDRAVSLFRRVESICHTVLVAKLRVPKVEVRRCIPGAKRQMRRKRVVGAQPCGQSPTPTDRWAHGIPRSAAKL